nr:basic proline-rich protein-like [Macaca fascicularis]
MHMKLRAGCKPEVFTPASPSSVIRTRNHGHCHAVTDAPGSVHRSRGTERPLALKGAPRISTPAASLDAHRRPSPVPPPERPAQREFTAGPAPAAPRPRLLGTRRAELTAGPAPARPRLLGTRRAELTAGPAPARPRLLGTRRAELTAGPAPARPRLLGTRRAELTAGPAPARPRPGPASWAPAEPSSPQAPPRPGPASWAPAEPSSPQAPPRPGPASWAPAEPSSPQAPPRPRPPDRILAGPALGPRGQPRHLDRRHGQPRRDSLATLRPTCSARALRRLSSPAPAAAQPSPQPPPPTRPHRVVRGLAPAVPPQLRAPPAQSQQFRNWRPLVPFGAPASLPMASACLPRAPPPFLVPPSKAGRQACKAAPCSVVPLTIIMLTLNNCLYITLNTYIIGSVFGKM